MKLLFDKNIFYQETINIILNNESVINDFISDAQIGLLEIE